MSNEENNRRDEDRLIRVIGIIALVWVFFLMCLTFGANHVR